MRTDIPALSKEEARNSRHATLMDMPMDVSRCAEAGSSLADQKILQRLYCEIHCVCDAIEHGLPRQPQPVMHIRNCNAAIIKSAAMITDRSTTR